jgi:hypothetical protein
MYITHIILVGAQCEDVGIYYRSIVPSHHTDEPNTQNMQGQAHLESAHCSWSQPTQRALAFSVHLAQDSLVLHWQASKHPSKLTRAFTVFSVVPKGCNAHTQPRVTTCCCHTQLAPHSQVSKFTLTLPHCTSSRIQRLDSQPTAETSVLQEFLG